MTHAARYLATGSILALMTAFSFTASAQDRNRMNGSDNSRPTMQDNCVGVECMPDRGQAPERTQRPDNSKAGKNMKGEDDKRRDVKRKDNNDNNDSVNRKREARNDWKYDSNRHKRNRNKDARYRYYYGGYWYLEPYWNGPVNSRMSCGEGRSIINDSGFNRVRTIECEGRNYTYAARRKGDTFRVSVNSRTGQIVSVRPM